MMSDFKLPPSEEPAEERNPMSETLSLRENEVELDYEAEEDEKDENEAQNASLPEEEEGTALTDVSETIDADKNLQEEDEELEEGELSDEDEESRKERLKPQPVCRFYSKGQCTWGSSCRFVHPGVLDKGNYSMFAPPRPILPGLTAGSEEMPIVTDAAIEQKRAASESPTKMGTGKRFECGFKKAEGVDCMSVLPTEEKATPVPRVETAWERGLRQAKEMKRLSQQRKETDVEYEEKKTTMSLTQAELDKENDYYARPASPIRDNDSDFGEEFDEFVVRQSPKAKRRIAPPPPDDFYGGQPRRRYPPPLSPSHSLSPPPRPRRVAPPLRPSDEDSIRQYHAPSRKNADEWADPWMRSAPRVRDRSPDFSRFGSTTRPRSYSPSHSSSRSSSTSSSRSRLESRTRGRRRRRSSSSSRSSRSSRSRSSTPKGIPLRAPPKKSRSPRSRSRSPGQRRQSKTPLQKRLHTTATFPPIQIKQEPESQNNTNNVVDASKTKNMRRKRTSSKSSESRSRSPPARKRRMSANKDEPQTKTSANPPSRPKPAEDPAISSSVSSSSKAPKPHQIRMTVKTNLKSVNRSVLEKLGSGMADQQKTTKEENDDVKKLEKKKEKKSAAERREELLKQLKAVENAIAKKRTKISNER